MAAALRDAHLWLPENYIFSADLYDFWNREIRTRKHRPQHG
jgi:hypothetical protein